MNQIPALIRVFAYLSLLTVGGAMSAFPELKTLAVDVHKWLTFPQLIHLYSLGQVAPGPNIMMIVAIGEWAAGPLGAIVVVLAFFGPTALLTFLVGRLWKRLQKWPWRTSIQKGLAPVSIGLLLAGCFTMARGSYFRRRDGSPRSQRAVDSVAVQDQSCPAHSGWRDHRCVLLRSQVLVGRHLDSFSPTPALVNLFPLGPSPKRISTNYSTLM
jgi:chromate transporter